MIKVQLDNIECLPEKVHKWDAGFDLRSNEEDFTLEKFGEKKVHTGVRMEIPARYAGMVFPRSGLGCKYKVKLANTVGIIDSEYRGEIIVHLINDGSEDLEINRFDRFCQIVVVPVYTGQLRIVDQVSDSHRGEKGFGDTGVG